MVMETYDKESSVYDSKRTSSEGGKHIDPTEKRLLARYATGPTTLESSTASGRFVRLRRADGLGLPLESTYWLACHNSLTKWH